MNKVNPFLNNSMHKSKFNIEGLHVQPRGKNVLQGVMTAYNSNEGMGVSIKQNVIQERDDLYQSMKGMGFGRNLIGEGSELRADWRMKSLPNHKHIESHRI